MPWVFVQFHNIIIDNQIGALTMDIVELEIKRTELRSKEDGLTPSELAQRAMDARAQIKEMTDRHVAPVNFSKLIRSAFGNC